MKKAFCMFLLLALLAVGYALAADSGSCGENTFWTYDSGVLTITGTGEMDNWNPGQQPWYQYQESITSVVIDSGITSIGNFAFRGCRLLADVSLPNSLTSMGFEVFSNCTSLTSISIPDQISQINFNTFYGCSNLINVSLPLNLTQISAQAFANCSSLRSINLPEALLEIGDSAFSYCTSLTSILLPENLNSINTSAFYDCNNLTVIMVAEGNKTYTSIDGILFSNDRNTLVLCPSGKEGVLSVPDCTTIGPTAFAGCNRLSKIILPEGLSNIDHAAFSGCVELANISLPDTLSTLGDSAFASCTGLTSISLPNSLTTIGNYAFSYCSNLTSISLPEGLRNINQNTFLRCINLKSIYIPQSVNYIGPNAFDGCSSLKAITIPDGITIINQRSFYDCSSLTSIIIPEGVSIIDQLAFYGCNSLTCVSLPESLTAIKFGAFSGGTHLIDFYYAGDDNNWASISIEPNNSNLTTGAIHFNSLGPTSGNCGTNVSWEYDSNILTISGSGEMDNWYENQQPWFHFKDSISTVVIGSGVTSIGDCAFYSHGSLTSVTIPASVVEIAANAFVNASPEITFYSESCKNYASRWARAHSIYSSVEQHSTIITDNELLPTCVSEGLTAGSHCSECGETIINQESIPALGHLWIDPTYAWDLNTMSVTASHVCDRCDLEEVETASSEPSITKPATCTEFGETTYVATFINSAFLPQEKVLSNIEPLGHEWGTPVYQWSEDNSTVTAIRYCLHNQTHVDAETVAATSAITKAPTCTEMGETTYTGAEFQNPTFLAQTKVIADIQALGHSWSNAIYEWSEDYSKVTASHFCARDMSHLEVESVSTTSEVTKPTSCESAGETTYISKGFSNNSFSVQIKVVPHSPLGHDWSEAIYTWSDDNSHVTAIHYCKRDTSHTETETVESSLEITKPATYEAMGETTYTAVFSNPLFAMQSKVVANIEQLDYEWSSPTYKWADDYSSVTASRVSQAVPSIKQTETVNAIGRITKAATCTAKGETTYTSQIFDNPAFMQQIIVVANIPLISHTEVIEPGTDPTFSSPGLTEKRYCSVCGKVFQNHEEIPVLTIDISCEKDQYQIYEPIVMTLYCEYATMFSSIVKAYDSAGNYIMQFGSWDNIVEGNEAEYTYSNSSGFRSLKFQFKAYANGVWSGIFEKTVYVDQPLGTLSAPVITAPYSIVEGNDLVISISSEEFFPSFRWTLYDDTNNSVMQDDLEHEGTIIIPANILSKGTYTFSTEAYGVIGYRKSSLAHQAIVVSEKKATYTGLQSNKTKQINLTDGFSIDIPEAAMLQENNYYVIKGIKLGIQIYTQESLYNCVALRRTFANDQSVTLSPTTHINGVTVVLLTNNYSYGSASGPAAYTVLYFNTTTKGYRIMIDYPEGYSAGSIIAKDIFNSLCRHLFVDDVAKAPSCETIGLSSGKHCSVCGKTYTKQNIIPALGHNWDIANYSWSSDYSSVTAKRICKRNHNHIEEETASAMSVYDLPTEISGGGFGYQSLPFDNDGFKEQTFYANPIPALSKLNVLKIPTGTKIIEDEAFSNLACEAVIIPDTCQTVGANAFRNCKNLIYVQFNYETTIDDTAFDYCDKLQNIYTRQDGYVILSK